MSPNPDSGATANENRILSLFDGAGAVETPTAGVKAWIAYDSAAPGRPVLIKRVPTTAKGRATEALTLRHPNIVSPRRWLADGNNLYVIRDVQRGKNIRQALSAGSGQRPSPELFRRLFLPLVSALETAHARGVAHGGISPENIIVGEDGTPYLCDFATADPKASVHFSAYKGKATPEGDIKAFSRVLATYLPNSGPFSSLAVRGRLEGLLNRCDTLADLRATIETLDRLAASAPPEGNRQQATGNSADSAPPPARETTSEQRMPSLRDMGEATGNRQQATGTETAVGTEPQHPTPNTQSPPLEAPPFFEVTLLEKLIRVPAGGGGAATLAVKNNGRVSVAIRQIVTQHAWVNIRPVDLPLVLAGGAEERFTLNVSAARLTPGDYRSEVYVAAARSGAGETDPGFQQTCELRVSVESPGLPTATPPEKPPYPADAPKLPATPGCGVLFGGAFALLALAAALLPFFR